MTAISSRSLRAVSEYMSVVRDAPDLYTVVSESGREYVVDLRDEPACTCHDFQYRPEIDECKHILRARLETGRADVDQVKGRLALAAIDAEEEAEKLERASEEVRSDARRIRRAVERLEELAKETDDGEEPPEEPDDVADRRADPDGGEPDGAEHGDAEALTNEH